DLADLAPDFVFFFGDVRNDVVDDVEAEYPAVAARAGDGLQRRHHHGIDTKSSHQWCQRNSQPDRSTIRIRRDKAFPAALLALGLDEPGMVIIDARNQDWHIIFVAKRRSCRQHWAAFGVLGLEYSGSVRLDASKNDIKAGGFQRLGILHRQVKKGFLWERPGIPAQRPRRRIT